jgi:hypothetical protein
MKWSTSTPLGTTTAGEPAGVSMLRAALPLDTTERAARRAIAISARRSLAASVR